MYRLELTTEDVRDIRFVGDRYFWSLVLLGFDAGTHEFSEQEAWAIQSSFEADTEGGHSMFPMLDPNSELAAKLYAFLDSIV